MLDGIWQQFLTIAKEEVGTRVVETWFKSITLLEWDIVSKTVLLSAPNAFIRDWVIKHYKELLQLHLGRLLHCERPIVEIRNVTDIVPDVDTTDIALISPKNIVPAQEIGGKRLLPVHNLHTKKIGTQPNENYVFDTYVVAPSNSLAYAAAYAITDKPGQLYNPLLIYGKSGLGKTHLMHAIANEIKRKNSKAQVLYQSADRFMQDFIGAIRFDKMHAFQAKYQKADVLLIDDMQFMAHKEQTQEALFQLFNALYDAQKQIVFSSDTFPQNMDGIAERLRSRMAWGLVTDIHKPSLETKVAILKKKAARNKEEIPDDVAHFIASHVTSNVRELEGALVRILAFASLTKQNVTLDLAQAVLFRTMNVHKEANESVDFNQILKCITKYYNYDIKDLRSKNRNKDLVFARHVTMFLMKKLTNKSLRDIGNFLGSRNHATVKHAVGKIEQYSKKNLDFMRKIKRIQQEVLDI